MKATLVNGVIVIDKTEIEKLLMPGAEQDENRGRAIIKLIEAIGRIERALGIEPTDFSEWVD